MGGGSNCKKVVTAIWKQVSLPFGYGLAGFASCFQVGGLQPFEPLARVRPSSRVRPCTSLAMWLQSPDWRHRLSRVIASVSARALKACGAAASTVAAFASSGAARNRLAFPARAVSWLDRAEDTTSIIPRKRSNAPPSME